jgi:stearoyl-CoA desaturase (delta-9 desaturase)
MRIFYLIFGACAMQNSVLHWATDHRLHHRYTDTDKDPYNAGRGFWWSHVGWVFHKSSNRRDFSIVPDLIKDKWVMWQHKYNVLIGLVVGFGGPALLGYFFDRTMGFLLWGGLIRVVFVHHATFFINSLAHMPAAGKQPYSRSDSSRDSWWLAFLTNGEGYHNFHHRFPSDYRNGIRWYQWDPTKWLIAGLRPLGVTWRLHKVPDHLILRARMEAEAFDAERHLVALPHPMMAHWRERMESTRKHFEAAIAQWAEDKAKYWEAKKAELIDSERLAHYKAKAHECELKLEEARENWRSFVQSLRRAPAASL